MVQHKENLLWIVLSSDSLLWEIGNSLHWQKFSLNIVLEGTFHELCLIELLEVLQYERQENRISNLHALVLESEILVMLILMKNKLILVIQKKEEQIVSLS